MFSYTRYIILSKVPNSCWFWYQTQQNTIYTLLKTFVDTLTTYGLKSIHPSLPITPIPLYVFVTP